MIFSSAEKSINTRSASPKCATNDFANTGPMFFIKDNLSGEVMTYFKVQVRWSENMWNFLIAQIFSKKLSA
jgi:hypothetical protein